MLSGGFTIAEQVEALESVAQDIKTEIEKSASAANTAFALPANGNIDSMTSRMNDSMPEEEDEDEDEFETETESFSSVGAANTMASSNSYAQSPPKLFAPSDIKPILAMQLISSPEPNEELVSAVTERIDVLDKKDLPLAYGLRKIMQNWYGAAINSILLKDLKNKRADAETVVKLLTLRKDLREKQSSEIFDARRQRNRLRAVGLSVGRRRRV